MAAVKDNTAVVLAEAVDITAVVLNIRATGSLGTCVI